MAKRLRGNLSCSRKALLAVSYVAAVVGLMAHGVSAQDASKAPAFDVATIKPAEAGKPVIMTGIINTPNGIDAEYVTLPFLIRFAYGWMKFPLDDQVIGAPDWAKSQQYNILAKMSDEDAAAYQKLSPEEQRKRTELMLQALLAERFKLKIHTGTKQAPDYELVVARNGLKLKPVADDDPGTIKDRNGQTMKGSMVQFLGEGKLIVQQYTMEQFANFLTQQRGEPGRWVVDKTGLTGKYSFTLNWLPNRSMVPGAGSAAAPGDDARSLFTILQEDLGLRLQPSTGTTETLILDHIERPTEN